MTIQIVTFFALAASLALIGFASGPLVARKCRVPVKINRHR